LNGKRVQKRGGSKKREKRKKRKGGDRLYSVLVLYVFPAVLRRRRGEKEEFQERKKKRRGSANSREFVRRGKEKVLESPPPPQTPEKPPPMEKTPHPHGHNPTQAKSFFENLQKREEKAFILLVPFLSFAAEKRSSRDTEQKEGRGKKRGNWHSILIAHRFLPHGEGEKREKG